MKYTNFILNKLSFALYMLISTGYFGLAFNADASCPPLGDFALVGNFIAPPGVNPEPISYSPDGRFLTIVGFDANADAVVYSVNQTTGVPSLPVTYTPPVATSSARSVSYSPNGRFLTITYQTSQNIISYLVNPATGVLTLANTNSTSTPFTGGYSPDSRFFAVANNTGTITVYSVNQVTGMLTFSASYIITPNAFTVNYSPNGLFAVSASGGNRITVFSVNAVTGVFTQIGTATLPGGVTNTITAAYTPDSRFVTAVNSDHNLIAVYPVNSNGTLGVPSTVTAGGLNFPSFFKYLPNGCLAFFPNFNAATISVYSVNQTTGVLTPDSIISTPSIPDEMDISPDGRFFAATNLINSFFVYRISLNLAQVTNVVTNCNIPTTFPVNDCGCAVQVTAVGTPAHGTATFSLNKINYKPNTNFTGTDSFSYTVQDSSGNASSSTVNVTVLPNTKTIFISTKINTPVSKNIVLNTCNKAATITSVTDPAHGTVAINPDLRTITYTPDAGFLGVDNLNYTLSNGQMGTVVVTVSSTGAPNPGRLTPAAGSLEASSIPTGFNPASVAYSPDGTYVSVANEGSNTISVYKVDPRTGLLIPINGTVDNSSFPTQLDPVAIRYSPRGAFATVVNRGSNTVTTYSVDPTTGALTPITGSLATSSVPTQLTPTDIAYSPDGNFASVTNRGSNAITIYKVDPTTGALTPINGTVANSSFPTQSGPVAVEYSPDGAFAAVVNQDSNTVTSYRVDPNTGAFTPSTGFIGSSSTPTQASPADIAYSPDGTFAAVVNRDSNTVTVYRVNQTTGLLTPITGSLATSSFPTQLSPRAIRFSPDGNFVAVTNFGSDTVTIYLINKETGELTPVNDSLVNSSFPTQKGPIAISFSPDGNFVSVVNNDSNTVTIYRTNISNVVANPTFATTRCATPVEFTVDALGNNIAISNISTPANGTATFSGLNVIYTPNTGFLGTDTFDYTVIDPLGNTSTSTITVTVLPIPRGKGSALSIAISNKYCRCR